MVEGSGFLQWLSVYALALNKDLDVLLLDEPDAHLHPVPQGHLTHKLAKLCENKKQVLLATHSTTILSETTVVPSVLLPLSITAGPGRRETQAACRSFAIRPECMRDLAAASTPCATRRTESPSPATWLDRTFGPNWWHLSPATTLQSDVWLRRKSSRIDSGDRLSLTTASEVFRGSVQVIETGPNSSQASRNQWFSAVFVGARVHYHFALEVRCSIQLSYGGLRQSRLS